MIGLRLGPVDPRLLLHDLFLQRPHRVEVLLELVLILFAELALQHFGLFEHHIQNTAVQLELLPLLRLGCSRFLEEQRAIRLQQINRRHLHARSRKADQVGFIHAHRQRRKPRCCANMLSHLLVEAEVAFREPRRQVRSHTTEQHRHTLMPPRVAVVKIGEDREIPAMPLERLQRRRQRVIRARRGWEKALLINTVIVRQTNKPLHRPCTPGGLLRRTQCRHRLKQRQRNGHASALQEMSSVNVHQSNTQLGQANEVKKMKGDPSPVNLSPDGYFSGFSNPKQIVETLENIEFWKFR